MSELMTVSASPHVKTKDNTRRVMLDVLIALAPAAIAGVVIFGLRALAVLAVSVASAILAEYLFNLICRRPHTVGDLSAAVTGLLLGMNVPANLPLWQAAVGSVFAIVVVKCLFGGIGKNFANPAITARIFMTISFGSMAGAAFPTVVDAVATATPLSEMKAGATNSPSYLDMLLGLKGGAIGEVCALALIVGFVYLLVRRVITWHTTVCFVGGVFLLALLFTGSLGMALTHVLSGGLLLGAIFMATDYTTTPITKWGRALFGIGCALITVVIRMWGAYPEGVSFAILLMNILTPYLERWTQPKVLGGAK
ncbi:MAG: RnfABCDGE type electron transport complex subunit D [Clostridia bacterium]|nr:RnfABCDGE type electron transport complex subunit D [Clostridia bacterium]